MRRSDSVWTKYHKTGWTEYPECSMAAFLRETAETCPENTALECNGIQVSFRALMAQIDDCAAGLAEQGIRSGDFVSVVMPNTIQAVVAVYALNRIGAVASMLHPQLSRTELKAAIEEVRSAAVITQDTLYPRLAELEWENGTDPLIILAAEADTYPPFRRAVYRMKKKPALRLNPRHRTLAMRSLFSPGHKRTPEQEDTGRTDDLAVILYSGGTSGKAKGVMLTNGNFNSLACQVHDLFDSDDLCGVHTLALMPVFHGFGLGVCIHSMMCNAHHVFLVPTFDMNECTELIFRRKICHLFGVPALYEVLSRSAEMETKDCSFLKLLVSAGDHMSPELMDRLNRKLEAAGSPAKVREAYGLTECTCGCSINPFFAWKRGSLGFPYTDTEMKIVDEKLQTLPAGEIGEICVCGPTVMKGYLHAEEATAETLKRHEDGKLWLHTGDLGYQDEDGYFFYSQRKSRMIITAGYNVYPAEVEKAILGSGIVLDCCVIGQPDRVVGERVRAFAVLKDPAAETALAKKEILDACRERVAEYALPKEIVIMKELPLSPLGKVDYRQLMEWKA